MTAGMNKLLNKWVWCEWLDSAGPTSSWIRLSEYDDNEAYSCVTVGKLVAIDKDAVSIAGSYAKDSDNSNAQVTGVMIIPVCSITSMVEIL